MLIKSTYAEVAAALCGNNMKTSGRGQLVEIPLTS